MASFDSVVFDNFLTKAFMPEAQYLTNNVNIFTHFL